MSAIALSAGVQQLYNNGLLPSTLSPTTLNQASTGQLSTIANSSLALQEIGSLLGTGSSSTDSATLSSVATNALLQEINPQSTSGSSSNVDPLTQAINNDLTASLNAAVSRFSPQAASTSGSQVNFLA